MKSVRRIESTLFENDVTIYAKIDHSKKCIPC